MHSWAGDGEQWDLACGPNSWCPRRWLGTVRFRESTVGFLQVWGILRIIRLRDGVAWSHYIGAEAEASDTGGPSRAGDPPSCNHLTILQVPRA